MNWAKSILCPFDDVSISEISSQSRLVVVDCFTYLDIVVHKDVHQFDALNLSPTRQYITQELKAWEGHLTLIGRINIFKMVLLLKLLYLYRAAPHILPKMNFDSLDKLLASFLWRTQIPMLSRDTLNVVASHYQIYIFTI